MSLTVCENNRNAPALVTPCAFLTTPLLIGASGMTADHSTALRKCIKCLREKPRSEFYRQPRRKDGLFPYCRQCSNRQSTLWRQNNPDKDKVIRQRTAAKHPFGPRASQMKSNYGLDREQYESMLREQDGKCAIPSCGKTLISRFAAKQNSPKFVACVDHDHSNGRVRGLLCNRCNYVVGCVEKHSSIVVDARRYLETQS